MSENGWLLVVWGLPASFGANPTKSTLTDVNSFSGFHYGFYNTGEEVNVTVEDGLVENTEYAVYMIAFNDDPRKNALSSAISSSTFTVQKATSTSSARVIKIVSAVLLAMTIALIG